jgi:hypothetical protein
VIEDTFAIVRPPRERIVAGMSSHSIRVFALRRPRLPKVSEVGAAPCTERPYSAYKVSPGMHHKSDKAGIISLFESEVFGFHGGEDIATKSAAPSATVLGKNGGTSLRSCQRKKRIHTTLVVASPDTPLAETIQRLSFLGQLTRGVWAQA